MRHRLATAALLALLATSAQALDLPWPVAARRPHAIAVDGERVFLATGDNAAELVIADLDTGETLGTFDAAGGADALSVRVLEPGVVKLGRRQSDAPEVYVLDVTDPASVAVLSARERERNVRWKRQPPPPVRFRDANGDGVFRLACLGDSNTAKGPTPKWCEILAALIDDRRFEVVNLGWGGATVCENLRFKSDAAQQMEQALAAEADAVVLAFGTNDSLQGRRAEESLAAYQAQADVALTAGLDVFVAETPPMGGCIDEGCGAVWRLNGFLADAFPGRVVDFFTGFGNEMFGAFDLIHLNAAGQMLRAERALAVIGSPLRGRR